MNEEMVSASDSDYAFIQLGETKLNGDVCLRTWVITQASVAEFEDWLRANGGNPDKPHGSFMTPAEHVNKIADFNQKHSIIHTGDGIDLKGDENAD